MSIEIGDGGLGYIYLGDILIAGGGGESGWYTPGIYHNSTLGLISLSSDGSNWITIADKNLGASSVYSSGTPTSSNGGLFYQWGNCYGFPFDGSISTSSSQVNASNYGPNNYYSSSTFIYGNKDWSSPTNNNLWGDTTNTSVARKGPCDSGYHIASASEWNDLLGIGNGWSLTTGAWLIDYLKIPVCGFRNNASSGKREYNGSIGFYWSSSPGNNNGYGGFLQFTSSQIDNNLTTGYWKGVGENIRPFKDEAVVPNSSWTVIYQPN